MFRHTSVTNCKCFWLRYILPVLKFLIIEMPFKFFLCPGNLLLLHLLELCISCTNDRWFLSLSLIPHIWFGLLSIILSTYALVLLSVLNQPAVKKVLLSKPYNPTCSSSERTTGPTAEDSSCPVDKRVKPLPPERREASDSNNYQVRGQSDKKSEKDS